MPFLSWFVQLFNKWLTKELILLTDSPACAGKLWPLYLESLLCFQLECLNSGKKQEPIFKTEAILYLVYTMAIYGEYLGIRCNVSPPCGICP
jgi:hypothetical protein